MEKEGVKNKTKTAAAAVTTTTTTKTTSGKIPNEAVKNELWNKRK